MLMLFTIVLFFFFFFFQAEDGIRDPLVTGVQTCALPICAGYRSHLQYTGGLCFRYWPAWSDRRNHSLWLARVRTPDSRGLRQACRIQAKGLWISPGGSAVGMFALAVR